MNNQLRQLQLNELEILNEFIRICEKHRLRYYIVGGTLLGAVRHQGFIPWDDDIDVGMLREDYELFAAICQNELQSDYFYQSQETDPHYFLTYAKLRKNGTEVYEERFKNAQFHKGIFIDIFPLDFCPKPGLVCHFLFNVLAVMNYRGQVDSGENYCPYEEWIGKIGYKVLGLFSAEGIVKIRKGILWLSKTISKRRYMASYSGAYGYIKEVYPVKWFGNDRKLVFENKWCNAPECAELFLTRWYGADFRKLPQEECRKKHIELY